MPALTQQETTTVIVAAGSWSADTCLSTIAKLLSPKDKTAVTAAAPLVYTCCCCQGIAVWVVYTVTLDHSSDQGIHVARVLRGEGFELLPLLCRHPAVWSRCYVVGL